jgi:hypothetical protein
VIVPRAGFFAALLLIAGCAPNGVTLRSNHYRVYVPPEWEVVETGGDSGRPTLLRTRQSTDNPGVSVEVRLYGWPEQGPLADPAGAAYKRLADAGSLSIQGASVEDEESPCPDHHTDFVVFGSPARSLRFTTPTAQNGIITAGHADGSLVGIAALTSSRSPACAEVEAMTSAIRRLAAAMRSSGDLSRPALRPTFVGRSGFIPPADPGALQP